MAMKIIHSYSEKIVGTVNYIRADLMVDSAAELPAADGVQNFHLQMGSVGYVINDHDFYVMNSAGSWIKNGE